MDFVEDVKNKIYIQMDLLKDLNSDIDLDKSVNQEHRYEKSEGITIQYVLNCCTLLITVNYVKGKIYEVFIHTGPEGGGCIANLEGLSRMVSLGLQNGIHISKILAQLKGIRCPAVTNSMAKGKEFDALSCPDAIYRTLQKVLSREEELLRDLISRHSCPHCGDI